MYIPDQKITAKMKIKFHHFMKNSIAQSIGYSAFGKVFSDGQVYSLAYNWSEIPILTICGKTQALF